MQRHENVVTKDRKSPSTGSGRAWNENEETYLLHSRLQKMPYKHIATHLNKTELACRLHYHQLQRGSTRRRRDVSPSSVSSDATPRGRARVSCSPVYRGNTRSLSPSVMGSPYLPRSVTSDVQFLPRIVSAEESPRPLALMPRSEGVAYSQHHVSQHCVSEGSPRYSTRTPDYFQQQHTLPPVLPHRFGSPAAVSPLRLDTSSRPWSSSPAPVTAGPAPTHIELPRLGAIYEKHKNAFWAVVADEYGMNASPVALEQAWRSGPCCQYNQGSSKPMTPTASPDKDRSRVSTQDVTRISSIIDDNY
ncbi:hypothetical protein E4U54_005360 [Claviceps lovelessii]|nr:hypothetical protein E4U54_005360 [Claviceps lovelessii]